jgi:hypothetical protein
MRQRLRRARTLQRQQRALGHRHHLAAVADVGDQVADVGVLAAGVDHQQQVGLAPRHHHVVEDAAAGVGEQGVTLLAHGQPKHVHRHQCFQRPRGVVANQAHLAHVRHVEQRGRLAALLVLGNDAAGIVDRHVVAGKGHHAGAMLEVQCVQRGLQQVSGHRNSPRAKRRPHFGRLLPSLSALPERLAPCIERGACPFGGLASSQPLSSEERPVTVALASPFA